MFTGNFIGRVGKDAEVVKGVNDTEFVSMDLAENYYSKGETKTRWIRVRCSTPRALKMAQYWTKGRQLEVVGELANINIYEDSQGKPQYQMIVNAFRVEFVNTGKKKDGQETTKNAKPAPVSEADRQATPSMPFEAPATEGTDDLPF